MDVITGWFWPEGEILKVLDQSPPPYELPTTTDRFQTLANTGSGFAHAREISRENGEQRGVSEGENADIGGVALARPRSESAPVLAGIDEKKPTDSGWFLESWWPIAESNHGHADFQSAALPTELIGQTRAHYTDQSAASQPNLATFEGSCTDRRRLAV